MPPPSGVLIAGGLFAGRLFVVRALTWSSSIVERFSWAAVRAIVERFSWAADRAIVERFSWAADRASFQAPLLSLLDASLRSCLRPYRGAVLLGR